MSTQGRPSIILDMAQEKCIGCGDKAIKHPWVAVTSNPDKKNVLVKFIAKPVCNSCHVDPAHRKTPIKGHFFSREDEKQGLALAGSPNISM